MIVKVQKIRLYSLGVFALILLVIGTIWVSYAANQKLGKSNNEGLVRESLLTVLNASYSAVPNVLESVDANRGFKAGEITTKGDSLLVLVNKSISLPPNYYPSDLTSLDGVVATTYSGALLRLEAKEHLVEMFKAAKTAGYTLTVTSAYRSYATQQATFNQWVARAGLAAASTFSALAGHSQHQLGTASDISAASVGYSLTVDFGQTVEGKWLATNSYRYGFVLSYPEGKESITGYSYEPWHFRYIGVVEAGKMHDLGWDLETYLQKYGIW